MCRLRFACHTIGTAHTGAWWFDSLVNRGRAAACHFWRGGVVRCCWGGYTHGAGRESTALQNNYVSVHTEGERVWDNSFKGPRKVLRHVFS